MEKRESTCELGFMKIVQLVSSWFVGVLQPSEASHSLQCTGACLQHQPFVHFRNSSPTSATYRRGPKGMPSGRCFFN